MALTWGELSIAKFPFRENVARILLSATADSKKRGQECPCHIYAMPIFFCICSRVTPLVSGYTNRTTKN